MITNLFQCSDAASSSPFAGGIANDAISGLVKKAGIPDAAEGIVSQLLPKVMDSLKSKTNEPNDNSFDLQGIIRSLTSGETGGINSKVKGLFGM